MCQAEYGEQKYILKIKKWFNKCLNMPLNAPKNKVIVL